MPKKTFIEYLKITPHNRWNFAILKRLAEEEEIDFSEKLVNYLRETPWNTNWNMINSLVGSNEKDEYITFPFTTTVNVSKEVSMQGDLYLNSYSGYKQIPKKWDPNISTISITVIDASGKQFGEPINYSRADDIDQIDIYAGLNDDTNIIEVGIEKREVEDEAVPGEWTFIIDRV